MKDQDFLREQVKLAKVYNDDWSYKQMAEAIEISAHSFYNWLNGFYSLSYSKKVELQYLISNLLDA